MTTENKGDWGFTDDILLSTEKFNTDALRIVGNVRIRGTLIADQNGKLRIKQGMDGTNWDYETVIAFTAGVSEAFDIAAVGLYCDIEVENDSGSDQTYMRLGWKLTSKK